MVVVSRIGCDYEYGRVSTIDQSLDLQEEKLKEYGCEKIFWRNKVVLKVIVRN